jgi:hypothetical protein
MHEVLAIALIAIIGFFAVIVVAAHISQRRDEAEQRNDYEL